MGIFDVFTGDPAKKAAADNTAAYNAYGNAALGDLNTGLAGQKTAVQGAVDAWKPVSALGTKYGAGSDLYSDSLGINGADGNARATDAFTASPGYQWSTDQALDGVMRNQNRLGGLGGNAIDAVTRLGSNLANQEYSNWQTKLGGFMPAEASAVTSAAGGVAAGRGAEAGMYANDAMNRANVRGTVTSGIANSNTASANAEMQGSSNFWGGLLGLGGNVAKAYAPGKAA